MKLTAALLVFVVLTWFLSPIPPALQDAGAYNPASHLMYCREQLACLHEVAHRIDQSKNDISQSPEFTRALQLYLMAELRQPVLSYEPAAILDLTYRANGETTGMNKREIYAYIFAWAHGQANQMPPIFQHFYDWQLAAHLVPLLNEKQVFYFLR